MKMMGWPSSIAGVAQAYEDFLDVLVVDNADEGEARATECAATSRVLCTNTIMKSLDDKRELARFVLGAVLVPLSVRDSMMRGILLIPVKSLATAKQRLAEALDQPPALATGRSDVARCDDRRRRCARSHRRVRW